MRRDRVEPLYRKVNTLARRLYHRTGGDYRHVRNTKKSKTNHPTLAKMRRHVRRGLDYTPLFRFLLSKVGCDWDVVHSEAIARLDREEPIYWMVARTPEQREAYVMMGESSYYSGLYVDEDNMLRVVDPAVTVETMEPRCTCCTYTFNGVPFVKTKPRSA